MYDAHIKCYYFWRDTWRETTMIMYWKDYLNLMFND